MEDFHSSEKMINPMKKQAETRKLVKWGSSKTLIMSLPRSWTKKYNLTEDNEVQVCENPDGSLLVLPLQFNREEGVMEAEIKVDQYPNREMLAHLIQTKFLDGNDKIHLTSKNAFTEADFKEISEVASSLTGFEILTKAPLEIMMKDMWALKESSLDELVKFLSFKVLELLGNFIKALTPLNFSTLETINSTKNDVFRYYLRVHRQLRKALIQPSLLTKMNITTQDAMDFAFFIVNLNDVATNIASMSNAVLKYHPKQIVERTLEILNPVSQKLNSAVSAFCFKNTKDALMVLSQVEELKARKRDIENDIDKETAEEAHIESQIILDNSEKIIDFIFSIALAALRRAV